MSKIYKEPLQISKKKSSPIEKGKRTWHSMEEIQMAIENLKMCLKCPIAIHKNQENVK